MTIQLSTASVTMIDGEPRILDTDLAAWLGMKRGTNIRATIAAYRDELTTHGPLHVARAKPRGTAYMLNESQVVLLCILCRTVKAAEVREALVGLFAAWRAGKLVAVKPHYRKQPVRVDDSTYDRNLGFVLAFKDDPYAIAELLAGVMTRLDALHVARANG